MFGEDTYRLRVLLIHKDQPDQVLFQKLGNYGNNWNYGQTQIWTNGSQQVLPYPRPGLNQTHRQVLP